MDSLRKYFSGNRLVITSWLAITAVFVIDSWITNRMNNYLIFENVFRNLLHQKSLYAYYPAFHDDANHYGPLFGIFIAPFAIFPAWLGLLFWNFFNCIILFYALQTLPLAFKERQMIGLIAIPCMIESMLNQQFNPCAAAFIILTFTQLNRARGFWSSFFLVIGTLVKLYGVVGIVFIIFVRDKKAYIKYVLMWACILIVVPMMFSSPQFVFNSYLEWLKSLAGKNANNVIGPGRDMSIMGFFRQLFDIPAFGNTVLLIFGAAMFLAPCLKLKVYHISKFQLLMLASSLIFPVIFSTGAEDCTFIISLIGVGLWYVLETNSGLKKWILPVLLIITCNFPLLFFNHYTDNHRILLSMISAVYFIVWIRILYIMIIDIIEQRINVLKVVKNK